MSLDTLASPASHRFEVKHSRFLARAVPIESSTAALAWLQETALTDATHNCWAWRIGGDYRSSDDGEPAGTAGRPILAAIDGQGFDHVVVLVTRWFGGIKLGAGGLIRAYGGAAAECLRQAARQPIVENTELVLRAGFDDLGMVHTALDDDDIQKLEESFDADGVRLRLRLPTGRADALKARLRNATRNRIRFGAGPD